MAKMPPAPAKKSPMKPGDKAADKTANFRAKFVKKGAKPAPSGM